MQIPDVKLVYFDEEDRLKEVQSHDLFRGKKVSTRAANQLAFLFATLVPNAAISSSSTTPSGRVLPL
jgi:hypothetical protein